MRIRERFAGLGGEELELPARQDAPRSAAAVAAAELWSGVRRLPDGKRRADIVLARERLGRPIATADAQIVTLVNPWDDAAAPHV
ncbi:hypothetical protein [Streptomyces sp. 4F14]|uniref:hypothetical protein n=1 Tax=Streptomyces sp. 4F14 TaxID=3394380 RepID=UPI003A884FE4